jgi:hypothetical protein
MEAVWKLHEKGMPPVEICRRRKITRPELKKLMRDHNLFSIHTFIAEQIYHSRIVTVQKGGRTKMRTLERRAKKQIKYQLSPAGLKRTLAKDPREATFAQPENLYWAVISYVNGTLFPAAKM